MKKAFSFIELIISISILTICILSLFQIKNNNYLLFEKTNENKKYSDFILISIDLGNQKNKEINLGNLYNFSNETIKKELKNVNINIKNKSNKIKSFIFFNKQISLIIENKEYRFEKKTIKNIQSLKIKL